MNSVHPKKAALEQYFLQVHSLEDELSDLRTKVSSLESQLQASRQEAVRWRILANDRLETMQKLGKEYNYRRALIHYFHCIKQFAASRICIVTKLWRTKTKRKSGERRSPI
jgi:hypothetical protein